MRYDDIYRDLTWCYCSNVFNIAGIWSPNGKAGASCGIRQELVQYPCFGKESGPWLFWCSLWGGDRLTWRSGDPQSLVMFCHKHLMISHVWVPVAKHTGLYPDFCSMRRLSTLQFLWCCLILRILILDSLQVGWERHRSWCALSCCHAMNRTHSTAKTEIYRIDRCIEQEFKCIRSIHLWHFHCITYVLVQCWSVLHPLPLGRTAALSNLSVEALPNLAVFSCITHNWCVPDVVERCWKYC